MKRFVVVAAFALTCACGTARDAEREEYRASARQKIAQLDERVAQLKQEARTAGAEARARLERDIGDLEKRRTELNARIARLDQATTEGLEKLKKDVRETIDSIDRSLRKE